MTALRIIDTGEVSSVLVCNESDFNMVMEIVKELMLHAAYIFEQLPKDTATQQPLNHKQQLLDALPAEFDRQTYLSIARNLKIPAKTAENKLPGLLMQVYWFGKRTEVTLKKLIKFYVYNEYKYQ